MLGGEVKEVNKVEVPWLFNLETKMEAKNPEPVVMGFCMTLDENMMKAIGKGNGSFY